MTRTAFQNLDRLRARAEETSEFQCVSYRETHFREHLQAIAAQQNYRAAAERLSPGEALAYRRRA